MSSLFGKGRCDGCASRYPYLGMVTNGRYAPVQGRVAALVPEVCLKGATLAWEHRDPFDRLLAATTLALGIPLISADEVFDTLPDISRLW